MPIRVEDGINDTKNGYVTENIFCSLFILLSQSDGRKCGTSYAHQCTEGYQQVHQRKGNGQTGDGQAPTP